ncbi:hypothetical protein [Neisseria sp. Ec49-e6-T10]|uniref:hypothetical protein n=1 Tax=Neisseria sp. Ec49-e6-T10 TaxID=3140744 RepID=UPI003EB82909
MNIAHIVIAITEVEGADPVIHFSGSGQNDLSPKTKEAFIQISQQITQMIYQEETRLETAVLEGKG